MVYITTEARSRPSLLWTRLEMSVNSYFYDPIFESSSELADINRLFEATFQNRVGSPSENNTPIENRNQALPGNLRSR